MQSQGFLQRPIAATGLLQTATAAGTGSEAQALAVREEAVAREERELQQRTLQLQAEERSEAEREAQLRTVAQTLSVKEQQVAKLQNELVKEQQKVWRILRGRAAAASSAPRASPPRPLALAQLSAGTTQARAVQTLAARQAPQPQRRQPQRRQPLRLQQVAARRLRKHRGAAAPADAHGSDLKVIVAARSMPLPKAEEQEEGVQSASLSASLLDAASWLQHASDEDSTNLSLKARSGENADNDDLLSMS